MKTAKIVAPFIVIPALVGCDGYLTTVSRRSAQVIEEIPESSKPINDVFNESVENIELPLTEEDYAMLDQMESFLTKYTGNGKFNYGTIPRLLEGLKREYGIAGVLAVRIARTKIISELERFGVDSETENVPDNTPIVNYVTKAELDEFRENTHKLEARGDKLLEQITDPELKGKRIVFPEGISVEAIRYIKNGSLKLPPGAKLVDKFLAKKDVSKEN